MRCRPLARPGTLVVKIGPDARQRVRVALLDEGDHLLPDLAAKVERPSRSAGADQHPDLHRGFLEIGDLEGDDPTIPKLRCAGNLFELLPAMTGTVKST